MLTPAILQIEQKLLAQLIAAAKPARTADISRQPSACLEIALRRQSRRSAITGVPPFAPDPVWREPIDQARSIEATAEAMTISACRRLGWSPVDDNAAGMRAILDAFSRQILD
jgi:hypothetical protein